MKVQVDYPNMNDKAFIAKMEAKLCARFDVSHIESHNDSEAHISHSLDFYGQITHIRIIVVSDSFVDISLIERHRRVNALFREEMKAIHSIRILPYTVAEAYKKKIKMSSELQ